MKTPRIMLAIAASVVSASLAACGSSGGSGGSTPEFPEGSKMATIAKAGKLRVGVQTGYPLIGQQKLNNYSGFDVEIAKLIAQKLGLAEKQIEFVPVTTPTRETFIQQDKVDVVIAAYTITNEREKVIDFAGPYLESPSAFLVPAGNPAKISKLADLTGKRLCVAAGSAQEAAVRRDNPAALSTLVTFDSSAKCKDAVINGQADASSTEAAILASFASQSEGKLEVVGLESPYITGYYGIGVKQEENPVFCTWLNQSLADLTTNGSWGKAYDSTLGTVLGKAPTAPALGKCGSTLTK